MPDDPRPPMPDNTTPESPGPSDDSGHDPLDHWLDHQIQPLPPPPGTFELITRRARRRKLRRAAVTVVSSAAVAAGVLVATMNPALLHLTTPSETGRVAAGDRQPGARASGTRTQQPNGSGRLSHSTHPPAPSAGPKQSPGGPVPANFAPSSVTFVSPTQAWVIGQAGVPGSCYNGNICTSIASTSDGGGTWHGGPAPVAGAASGPNGVSGLRFLNEEDGWAFGPELWATHDGGSHWRPVDTFGQRVTDLEAAGDRAYALFADCSGTSGAGFAADCTSYTLMTTTAASDDWVPVGPATSNLTSGGSGGRSGSGSGGSPGSGSSASAMLALSGDTGYLVAPDGTLYSGPLDGGAWSKAGAAPCRPSSPPQANGLPAAGQLATVSPGHLAMACDGGPSASSPPAVWSSSDGGAAWTRQSSGAWSGTTDRGTIASLAAAPDGSLVLATTSGIFMLPAGAPRWQTATAPGGNMPSGGFSYIGMTSDSMGVALPADTSLHEIWVTTDGGHTWTPKPIR
ncbi:MAG: hypothetical protein J2P25_03080 [Nocardiopsaceae bacterium]|nr:hypothetical protein [Nocardiopsaceae bacterium]